MANREISAGPVHGLFSKHAETMLEKMIQKSDVLSFVYYPKTRSYEILNLPKGFNVVPMAAGDCPESIFDHVDMSVEHKRLFRDSVKDIEAGKEEVGFTVQVNPGGAGIWIRHHWVNFFDEDGNPEYVLAFGIDVTDKMKKERSFADQMLMREAAQSSIMIASCFNVTKDTVVKQNGDNPPVKLPDKPPCSEEMRLAILADEPEVANQSPETQYYFFAATAQLPDPVERKKFAHMCSHVGMLEAFREGKTEQVMNYSRMVDGVLSYVSTRLLLLADPETQDVYAFFYTVDMSEKKQDELVIDAVMRQSCDFVALIDPDTDTATFRYMSDKIRIIVPYWADGATICYSKMMDRAVEALIAPERQEEISKMISTKNIIEHLQVESPYYCSYDFSEKGKAAHKQVQYRWLHDFRNSILVVQQDVTAVWKTEQERSRKERENESILNQLALEANDFVAIIDVVTEHMSLRTGTWYANGVKTPPEQRETTVSELFKMMASQFLPDVERHQDLWDQVKIEHVVDVLDDEPEYVMVFDFVGADGKPKRKQHRYTWLDREAGKILYVRTDITKGFEEEQERNRRLSDALGAAEQANLAKTKFLSRMSHDIRTPMNAIIGFATLLLKDADNPERVADEARKVLASSNHLLGLINDVLDMSRIESGAVQINTREFRLADTIAIVDEIIRPQMEAKGQTFEIYVSGLAHDLFMADDSRLRQVLINILGNATKYTQAGGCITMKIKGLPASSSVYENVAFEIADNGRGMSKEFQKVIFTPFSRETLPGHEESQGTGLGLAITRNIVNIMGGTMAVRSELNKGSTFTVVLPLRIQEKESESDFWKRHSAIRMLAVDDDELVRRNIAEAMSGTGVHLDTAQGGEEALVMLVSAHEAERDYNIVLLDWKMPGMDGIETARRIRLELPADIHIIILTAYDYGVIEDEARAAGVDGFLQKPFFASGLQRLLDDLEVDDEDMRLTDTGKTMTDKGDVTENSLDGLNILAAEDNALNAEVLTEILKANGACTTIAADGGKLLEQFLNSEAGTYDLILMDVQMPVMNGYETIEAVRKLGNDASVASEKRKEAAGIPIVAMTADAFNEDVQKALLSGMNAHIAKPLDIDVFKATLARVIAAKKDL